MRFAESTNLWFLIPWAFLPLLWFVLESMARKRLSAFLSPEMLGKLTSGISPTRRRIRFVLFWVALAMGILALARPQMGAREEEIKSQGLDLVFALDVSNSMTTEDVVPSRLKKARHIIRSFVERLSGDRAGVVAFAGSSFPAIPLTTDYDYIRQTLETLNENSVSNQGTNLYSAIETSMRLLERGGLNEKSDNPDSTDDSGDKVIIVISDGEDHEGAESTLIPKLKKEGIRVYTIGVGTQKGGPMPMRDDRGFLKGYKRDASGSPVVSKLETKALESLASKANGKYFNATVEEGEVDEIIKALSTLERGEGGARRVLIYDEAYQYPLAVSLLLLLAMMGIGDRSRRRRTKISASTMAATLLVALTITPVEAADSLEEYSEGKKGVESYRSDDHAEAVNHFGKAQAENPDQKLNNYNLGTALLKSGSADAAIGELTEGTKHPDPMIAAKSAYNLGRAYQEQKQHEKALQSYQDTLEKLNELKRQQKFDDEAKEVEQRTKQALEATEQQKQQQQSQGDQGQGEGQEGQKGDQQKDQDQSGKQDNKDDQGKNQKPEEKRYQMPKEKQKFKAEQLSEQDAKRMLQQLKEQENQTLQRLRRNRESKKENRKIEDGSSEKDW